MDNSDRPPSKAPDPLFDEELERRQHLAFLRSVTVPNNREHDVERWVAIGSGVILLAIVCFGGYWLFFRNKPASAPAAPSAAHTTVHSPATAGTGTPTRPYTSSDFGLSLKYPAAWTVVDSGNGVMTVTSPSMQLTTAAGQTVSGQITLTIQHQGQLPAALTTGTALAVLDSEDITFTEPTANQASQTYLSFVQYSSTNTKGGLDALYITGNDGYQKDQIIPPSDIAGINPLITVTFTRCGNKRCTSNLTPLTIAAASWDKIQAPIMTMLTSLAFD